MKKANFNSPYRDISSMEELQYHKMRLELAAEILEDKIEGNIDDIKEELKPKNIMLNLFNALWNKIIGSRFEEDGKESEGNGRDQFSSTLNDIFNPKQ